VHDFLDIQKKYLVSLGREQARIVAVHFDSMSFGYGSRDAVLKVRFSSHLRSTFPPRPRLNSTAALFAHHRSTEIIKLEPSDAATHRFCF